MRGQPAISEMASLMLLSKHLKASRMSSDGHVRRTYETLGKARQLRSRVLSICESCRSASLETISCTLHILFRKEASQNSAGPTGVPSKSNPPEATGTSQRDGWEILTPSVVWMRHLDLFRCRPCSGPSFSMRVRAAAMSLTEPQSVPSSRYQALTRRPGTSA